MDTLQLISSVVAGLFVVVLTLRILKKPAGSANGRQAPEVAGAWPLLGHLRLLASSELPHVNFSALTDKYGAVYSIRVGIHRALVINSAEAARECFTTQDAAFSSRPKRVAIKHLGYNFAMFGLGPYGPYWREMRKITATEFLSNRRVELLGSVRTSEVENGIKELYKLWNEKKDGSGLVLVEMQKWLRDLTLNMMLGVVAGKRFSGAGTVEEAEDERRCKTAMKDLLYQTGLFVLGDAIPHLSWFDVGGREKAMKKTAKEVDKYLTEWLREHKETRASGEVKQVEDFMDVMLAVLKKTTPAGGFDADTINKAVTLTMLLGGTDSTAVGVTWSLSLLLNNPRALQKAQEELDSHVGRSRLVKESDISKLVYLHAVVKETLRLCPPAALSVRESLNDTTVGGYPVAKGTWLFVNIWGIQRDPLVWEEPLEFKPERFLTTHKNVEVTGKNFGLIPFGAGRRICPGMSFSLHSLPLLLANLIHAFDISSPENAPVDMTGSKGLFNEKATPLEVVLKPRLSIEVYA